MITACRWGDVAAPPDDWMQKCSNDLITLPLPGNQHHDFTAALWVLSPPHHRATEGTNITGDCTHTDRQIIMPHQSVHATDCPLCVRVCVCVCVCACVCGVDCRGKSVMNIHKRDDVWARAASSLSLYMLLEVLQTIIINHNSQNRARMIRISGRPCDLD